MFCLLQEKSYFGLKQKNEEISRGYLFCPSEVLALIQKREKYPPLHTSVLSETNKATSITKFEVYLLTQHFC